VYDESDLECFFLGRQCSEVDFGSSFPVRSGYSELMNCIVIAMNCIYFMGDVRRQDQYGIQTKEFTTICNKNLNIIRFLNNPPRSISQTYSTAVDMPGLALFFLFFLFLPGGAGVPSC
jgi:hypothetical protein